MKRVRIGIYGGTFDPIHHGHLILAREAIESLELEQLIFVPATQSPHKLGRSATSAEVRWEMLIGAIEGEGSFTASRVDLDRPPPSYSVDMVEQFRSQTPEAEFFFFIGDDNVAKLSTWHRFADLEQMVS